LDLWLSSRMTGFCFNCAYLFLCVISCPLALAYTERLFIYVTCIRGCRFVELLCYKDFICCICPVMDLASYQKKVDQSLHYLQTEFGWLQLGRATPWLIENIGVEASYGHMKLNQLGHVSVLDSQTLKVECRDKGEMKSVEKAIYDANIWLSPQNDGGYLIIRIPALTQERRIDLVKHVKTLGEETKGQIRRIRQDAMKDTKDLFVAKSIGEDLHKGNEEDIETMTKKANIKIDEMVDHKGEEVMKV